MSRADRTNAVHWVYRCFDIEGRLIYVGSTTNVFNRLQQHQNTSWWAPTVAKVNSAVYANGILARAVERVAIRDEIPRWNKAGKWVGRGRWLESDWHDWFTTLLRDGASAQLDNSIRDYESLFGVALPEPIATMYAKVQERATARRREMDHRDAVRARERVATDTRELAELNAELSTLLARQEALARALGIDWDDPDLYDPSVEIDAELTRREQAAS